MTTDSNNSKDLKIQKLDWDKEIPKEYQEKLNVLKDRALPPYLKLKLEKGTGNSVNAYDMSAANYQFNILEAFALGVELGKKIGSAQYIYDERGVIEKNDDG